MRLREQSSRGFSLIEMLVSTIIITLLLSAVFTFMGQVQKKEQSNAVISESNQGARAALEVMTQEIGQAGSNPNFTQNKVLASPSTTVGSQPVASADPQVVTLNDICQIFPGDWVSFDTGATYELAQVSTTSPLSGTNCSSPKTVGGTMTAVLQQFHCQSTQSTCTTPEPTSPAAATPPWPPMVASYKQPYPSGLLWTSGGGQSDDKTLEFFGNVNADGVLNYVVYSLYAPPGAATLSINGTTYTLYTLYRSVTPVTFASGAANNPASPLLQNVLYNTTNHQGPTGQPVFSYPNTLTVGIVPNIMTVVGTVVINLSVAVSPKALDPGSASLYYTMATQIRPLNLAAAVTVNQSGGGKFLPKLPAGLPMTNPGNYYQ
jgi:prepilin-type N-terminal cleavage/methylation domain-containing protein